LNQYFSSHPDVEHHIRTVTVAARGQTLNLRTDSGVFSKRGLDYGSRVLVESVSLPQTGTMVDLGCGYGPVAGLLAAVYPETRWILLDVNQRAVALALCNLKHLGSRIQAYESDGFAAVPDMAADAILLNPPIRAGKEVVYRLFAESRQHLSEGGQLWTVMQKKQGAESGARELKSLFSRVELVNRSGGYHVYCSSKSTQPL